MNLYPNWQKDSLGLLANRLKLSKKRCWHLLRIHDLKEEWLRVQLANIPNWEQTKINSLAMRLDLSKVQLWKLMVKAEVMQQWKTAWEDRKTKKSMAKTSPKKAKWVTVQRPLFEDPKQVRAVIKELRMLAAKDPEAFHSKEIGLAQNFVVYISKHGPACIGNEVVNVAKQIAKLMADATLERY